MFVSCLCVFDSSWTRWFSMRAARQAPFVNLVCACVCMCVAILAEVDLRTKHLATSRIVCLERSEGCHGWRMVRRGFGEGGGWGSGAAAGYAGL